jgi:CheY-like chemotaxis protein
LNTGIPKVSADRASRLKVLLIEDDANDVELLRLAFESASGPQPDVVFNGREAIEVIQARAQAIPACWPDVILCDLNMPVMNGFEFIKWLKLESPCPRIPVIVLTSSVVDTDVGTSYDLGAAAYLVKPSGHEELQALAKGLVDFWKLVQSPPLNREMKRGAPLARQ